MFVINHKNIFLGISAFLVLTSMVLVSIFGLNFGIDFKGGSILEVQYLNTRPENVLIQNSIKKADLPSATLQPTGELGLIVKTQNIDNSQKEKLLSALSINGEKFEEKRFNSIGPSIGKELRKKSIISIILVFFGIVLFIAYAFRRVSKPVSSWKYGFIAIIALLHDIIIPTGVFALLGYFYGAEVDTLFVVALLTILGLSVSDTIVVFDRIRENLKSNENKIPFGETVGRSLNQIYARSINTSFSTILVLLALVFFGPESTKYFAITLAIGMFIGTYSSIFLASPLLVNFEKWQKNAKSRIT